MESQTLSLRFPFPRGLPPLPLPQNIRRSGGSWRSRFLQGNATLSDGVGPLSHGFSRSILPSSSSSTSSPAAAPAPPSTVLVRAGEGPGSSRNGQNQHDASSSKLDVWPLSSAVAPTPASTSPSPSVSSMKQSSNGFNKLGIATAGAAMAALGLQMGANFLEGLERVPALAQMELLVGILVTGNLFSRYFGGGEGRARVESAVDDVLFKLSGESLESELPSEPSMLDVQLRALVQEHGAVANEVPRNDGLTSSLKHFIVDREARWKRINAVLRKDVEGMNSLRVQNWELKKELERYKSSAKVTQDEVAGLKSATLALQKERQEAMGQVGDQSRRVQHLLLQLQTLASEKKQYEALNEQLAEKLDKEVEMNKVLGRRLLQREGQRNSELEEVSQLREQLRMKMEEMNTSSLAARNAESKLEAQSQKLQGERNEAMMNVMSLTTRLQDVSCKLEAVERSRSSLLQSNKELQRRVEQVMEENRSLGSRIGSLEASKTSAPPHTDGEERQKQRDAVENVPAFLASRQKLELLQQKSVLYTKGKTDEAVEHVMAQMRSSLSAAEERALQSEKLVQQLKAQLEGTTKKAAEERKSFQQQAIELEEKLVQAQVQLHIANARADMSETKLLQKKSDEASSVVEKPARPTFGEDTARKLPVLQTVAEPVKIPDWFSPAEFFAGSEEAGAEPVPRKEPVNKSRVFMSNEDLMVYAKAIYMGYVDATLSADEQKEEFDALIQELMSKGADEGWARQYVQYVLLAASAKKHTPTSAPSKGRAAVAASGRQLFSNGGMGMVEEKVNKQEQLLTEQELVVYARAVRAAYVDPSMSASEQRAGVEMLVEELVHMGATEAWARSHVLQGLAKEQLQMNIRRSTATGVTK